MTPEERAVLENTIALFAEILLSTGNRLARIIRLQGELRAADQRLNGCYSALEQLCASCGLTPTPEGCGAKAMINGALPHIGEVREAMNGRLNELIRLQNELHKEERLVRAAHDKLTSLLKAGADRMGAT